jgi:hypothetical protein
MMAENRGRAVVGCIVDVKGRQRLRRTDKAQERKMR